MKVHRRRFLETSFVAGAVARRGKNAIGGDNPQVSLENLHAEAARPVLQVPSLKSPVKIASIELLRNGRRFLVRARSADGAEGIIAANDDRLIDLYPILLRHVIPYFIGKDARELDALVDGVYVHDSNYKMQGLALWVCVASVEFALLDIRNLRAKATSRSRAIRPHSNARTASCECHPGLALVLRSSRISFAGQRRSSRSRFFCCNHRSSFHASLVKTLHGYSLVLFCGPNRLRG